MQRTMVSHRASYWPAVVGAGLVAALVLQLSPAAVAEPRWVGIAAAWSSPGSAGVADESSVPLVTFDHAKAAVRPSAPPGSLVLLRYPIFLSRTWSGCVQPDQYAYWVEVALWKVNATSDPKIVAVGVHMTPP